VALNLLSSLVMIRLGRVHEGLMVDVQATNTKLVRRSENILRRLTGCGAEDARQALKRANGNVKLAVLLLHGCTPEQAARALEQSHGRLRKALEIVGGRDAHQLLQIAKELPSAVGHGGESDRETAVPTRR